MDLEVGLLFFEVVFLSGSYEYEYKLDAIKVEVVEWEVEWKRSNQRDRPSTPSSTRPCPFRHLLAVPGPMAGGRAL